MKLSKKLAEKFEVEFQKVFDKEKAEKDFLNQDGFESCRDRAEAGILLAVKSVIDDLGFCISVHREAEHGDDTLNEQASLLSTGADPEMGTEAWWND